MKFISILLVLSQLSAIAATHEKAAAHHLNNKNNEAAAKVVTEKFSQVIKEKFNEIRKEYGHKGHKDMREKTLSHIANAVKKAPMSKEAVEKNRKLTHNMNTAYSVARYYTTGGDCTGQVLGSEGEMFGQPEGQETLRQSYFNLCEFDEYTGMYAMVDGVACTENGDHYTESTQISLFHDHDCKNKTDTYFDYETLPKCDNNMKEMEGAKAIITECTPNPTPMNNFKGMYYLLYPPGTCGTKNFPVAYSSVILEDYCYTMDYMYPFEGKYLTGAKYKYNPTTNKLDYIMYFKDVPMESAGQDLLNNLGYNGGDHCDGHMEKSSGTIIEAEWLNDIHECILLDTEDYVYTQLQYIGGDGKITTKHTTKHNGIIYITI